MSGVTEGKVLTLGDISLSQAANLLQAYQLTLEFVSDGQPIPGSFWGEPEAGLIKQTVYARSDTPMHSLLHESCHVICMDDERRQQLHTDASGEIPEENAVCYLQILLAEQLDGFGRSQAFTDMDNWGYTFRLGSARLWFEKDADDARQWLLQHGLIDADNQPIYQLRS